MSTRPTIGRGPKVQAAVHAATVAELAATGYAALTVEAVATRAGVHKTTVYRRWADRDSLVADALAAHVAADVPIPDTGTAEGDLRALARALAAWLSGPTGTAVVTTMVAEGVRVPAIAELKRDFFAGRLERAAVVVTRAVERGELPAGTRPDAVVKAMMAPLYLRALITAEPVGDEAADQAARTALGAARAGVL
ncbi:TetR/AcrR family transcriptional regulator [Phytomonospora endophytica]|uniref:AcrR family transcriptional regulator n=1 Tax=Phytomonospora endophytica TaxID=714109 RepID=A0A841G1A1_9ACTN|nr:TetR/AcrR family transcriptional regulator [Phytomonospora endophytica]MBB6037940.1 AcrR family transcriptional regulator [Phytomonospora endophytica]GIG68840.1 putative transcriptional regulator, TetR family protein [Phytomonospora endophytica]